MPRKVTVELTGLEADALYSLADCSAMSYEDAEAVLVDTQLVKAGYRAIAKLRTARFAHDEVAATQEP